MSPTNAQLQAAPSPLDPVALASILHSVFPPLPAVELGATMLAPDIFPDTPAATMEAALIGAGYDAGAVAAAIQALYGTRPSPHRFAAITTAAQGGTRGIEFWSAGASGQVWTLYRTSQGDNWSFWEGPGFKNQPRPLRQLAAALAGNGCVVFSGLDDDGSLWTCPQRSPGGDWGPWRGPDVGGQPPVRLHSLVATLGLDGQGIALWALDAHGETWSLDMAADGTTGKRWARAPSGMPQPQPLSKLAVVVMPNGVIVRCILDDKGHIWVVQVDQTGKTSVWEVADAGSVIIEVAISAHGWNLGVTLWGVASNGQLLGLSQDPQSGRWGNWHDPGFNGQPAPMINVAAVTQRSGSVLLWASDNQDRLWYNEQRSLAGDWKGWVQASQPPS